MPAGTAPSRAKMIRRGRFSDAGTSAEAARSSPPVLSVCVTKPVVLMSPQEKRNSDTAAVIKVAQEGRRVTFAPARFPVVACFAEMKVGQEAIVGAQPLGRLRMRSPIMVFCTREGPPCIV